MNTHETPQLVLEFLLKSTLVLLLGFGLVALIRRSAPAGKHGLWQCLFTTGLALPLLLMFPRWEILPSWTPHPTPIPDGANSVLATDVLRPLPSSGSVPASPQQDPFSPSSLLLWIWVAGGLGLILQSIAVREFLRRLERNARPPGSPLRSRFEGLRFAMGVKRPVTLLLSPAVHSPFAWGLTRSRILLPESAERWTDSDLEMVLLHELEHVRRGDARAVVISRLFLALNWVNPLAWIALRQSVSYREEACDEAVMRRGHDSGDYADLLLRQARGTSAPILFSCATSVAETGTVEGRVRRILTLGSEASASTRSAPARWVALFAVLSVVVMALSGWGSVVAEDDAGKKKAIEEKMRSLVIPSVDFRETPLSEAIAVLERKTAELDPTGGGIQIRLNPKDAPTMAAIKLSLRLSNVPLIEALRYTTSLAHGHYRITGEGVEVVPLTPADELFTQVYQVPPSAFAAVPEGAHRAKVVLEKMGISFGRGTSALYHPESMKLIVRNTREQLNQLEAHFPQGRDEKGAEPARRTSENGAETSPRAEPTFTNVYSAPPEIFSSKSAKEKLESMGITFGPGTDAIYDPDTSRLTVRNTLDQMELVDAYLTSLQKTAIKTDLHKTLGNLILPDVRFNQIPLVDALDTLQKLSKAHDPAGKGINITLDLREAPNQGESLKSIPITLDLKDVPLADALSYTTSLAGVRYEVKPPMIVILPAE